MKRRSLMAILLILLLGTVVAIQLTDPRFSEPPPPEVDISEPPAEVAADAATQFEYADYSYRIQIKHQQKSNWDTLLHVNVDHTNRRYSSTGPLGENGTIIFANDALTFAKPGSAAEWQSGSNPQTTYPAEGFTQPFSIKKINNSNTTILTRNSTTVVMGVDNVILKVGSSYSGESKIVLSRKSGIIIKAISKYQLNGTEQRLIRFELEEENPEVNRPEDIPPSSAEIFWDLARGPLVRWNL